MRRPDDGSPERSTAGPVAGEGPPAHPPEDPRPTPPAGDSSVEDAQSSGAEAGSPDAAQEVEEDFDALLADTKHERDEYLELAQRTRADFENYRKRMTAEIQAAARRGKAGLAGELIGVIDNLERALAAAGIEPSAEAPPEEPLAQGILLTYRELTAVLEQAGVESYDPAGEKFDPAWHEALQTRPADGAEPGTVVEVLQKGFRLDGQVLRAARVVVSE
ncbi:MAG: nucleotide exchange factor GrpE [Solirubrobacterales bacterium]|nr:nucleotide exchange factor GrpE [Solirubrobacterales bacterium]